MLTCSFGGAYFQKGLNLELFVISSDSKACSSERVHKCTDFCG